MCRRTRSEWEKKRKCFFFFSLVFSVPQECIVVRYVNVWQSRDGLVDWQQNHSPPFLIKKRKKKKKNLSEKELGQFGFIAVIVSWGYSLDGRMALRYVLLMPFPGQPSRLYIRRMKTLGNRNSSLFSQENSRPFVFARPVETSVEVDRTVTTSLAFR